MTTDKKDTATELEAKIATLPPDLLAPLASSSEKKDRRSKDGKEKKVKDGNKKKDCKENKKGKSRKRVRTDTPELSDCESQPPKRAHGHTSTTGATTTMGVDSRTRRHQFLAVGV